jgi:hypothetical protein
MRFAKAGRKKKLMRFLRKRKAKTTEPDAPRFWDEEDDDDFNNDDNNDDNEDEDGNQVDLSR